MKRFFIILFSLILSCFPCKVLADELPYIQYLPEHMPQAPTAQAIARAIDIPVNYYTGIPNITIPLYTIQVGDISVPITLSYQGGGIRPSQEATCVGLGWMLNAGGAITRTVKCADDFMEHPVSGSQFRYGFLDKSEWPDLSEVDDNYYASFRNVAYDGTKYWDHYLHTDSEADIFFYSLPTQSGKFSFKKDKSIVYFDKSKNVRITPSFGANPRPYFYAVDAQGTGYCFETKERTEVYSRSGGENVNTTAGGVDIIYNSGAYGTVGLNKVADYTSTWYLTQMISATNDTIDFEYEDESFHVPLQESCRYQKRISGAYGFASGEGDGPKYSISKANVESKRLTKIKWRGGFVEFVYGNNREDIYSLNSLTSKSLTEVKAYNSSKLLVSHWRMYYDYFNDDLTDIASNRIHLFKRLRLDGIKNVLTGENPYKFSYYESVQLPSKNTKNLDYWGFYNGTDQGNAYYCPESQDFVQSYKSASEHYAKIGILQSIEYPTGGVTKFYWEANKVNEIIDIKNPVSQNNYDSYAQGYLVTCRNNDSEYPSEKAKAVLLSQKTRFYLLLSASYIGNQNIPVSESTSFYVRKMFDDGTDSLCHSWNAESVGDEIECTIELEPGVYQFKCCAPLSDIEYHMFFIDDRRVNTVKKMNEESLNAYRGTEISMQEEETTSFTLTSRNVVFFNYSASHFFVTDTIIYPNLPPFCLSKKMLDGSYETIFEWNITEYEKDETFKLCLDAGTYQVKCKSPVEEIWFSLSCSFGAINYTPIQIPSSGERWENHFLMAYKEKEIASAGIQEEESDTIVLDYPTRIYLDMTYIRKTEDSISQTPSYPLTIYKKNSENKYNKLFSIPLSCFTDLEYWEEDAVGLYLDAGSYIFHCQATVEDVEFWVLIGYKNIDAAVYNGFERGGLRIARIEGEKNIEYLYEGGKNLILPCISYQEELHGYDWTALCRIQPSESVRQLSTLKNGILIGYSKVLEIYEDNSKNEYVFYNEVEELQDPDFPYSPTKTEWKNGLVLNKISFDSLGDTTSIISNLYISPITTETYRMGFVEIVPGCLFYYDNEVQCPLLNTVSSTEYRKNGEYSIRKRFVYNNQLLCSEETIQVGTTDVYKTVYKYASDFSDATSRNMVECNQIGFPVAKWSYRNGILNAGTRYVFDKFYSLSSDGHTAICSQYLDDDYAFSGMHLPRYLLTLNTTNTAENLLTCNYDTAIIYNTYTRYGGKRDLIYKGMPMAYVWAYMGMYPIAEIRNTTYQQFLEEYGNPNIDINVDFCNDPEFFRDRIWNACILLDEVSVGINLYTPLVGVMEMTDSRGVIHSYKYDAAGRLSSTRLSGISNSSSSELTNSYAYGNNYVSSKNYLTWQSSSSIENIQYYDEWGRPSVSAAQGVKSDGTYSYSMQTYDPMGRPHRSYLSVPSSNTTGELLDATAMLNLSLAAFANDPFGYTQTSYDALGRAVETTMPGRAWNENGKSTTIQYLTNTANDVKRYTVSGNALVESGYYEVGTLDCAVTTDPDGLTIKSYKDLFGNIVLERRAGNFDTYYVYDNLNHLRFVLPPKYQVEKNLGYYAYQYEYDGRGRMVKKTLPGCEPIQYWYDSADRLVRMQDGVLAQSGYSRVWSYDGLGRQLSQGIERNGTLLHYEMLNFYDDYDFVENYTPYLPTTVSGLLPLQYYYDKHGYLTGTWQRTSDGQGMLSVMGYDDYGNLSKKTVSALGKFLVVSDYEHNLAGDVVNEQFREYRYQSSTDSWGKVLAGMVENNYSYPHTRLLTSSVLSLLDDSGNTLRTDTINHFTYDDFGRILRNNRGGTKADMTYEYTPMHSWLNRIRSGSGFDQRLYRETEGNTPRWNGGISAMTWKVNNAYLRRFDYDYDTMNRLTSAEYSQYEITGGTSLSPTLSLLPIGMENEDYTSEYGYDKNSNLLWAYRQGVVDDVEEGLYYDTMDDYNAYYRGNQKLSVGGTGVGEPSYYGSSSFVDGADEEVEYAYNANGSMTMDLNKGITNIAYDLLGNLQEITFNNNRIIRYVYTADGTRLRTIHLQKKNGVWLKDSTDYYGNLLLKNGKIDKCYFLGGYLSFSNNVANSCHYHILDYQGNCRMVVNKSGITEQVTHYYPYGGVIGGIEIGANIQPYKFGGKELDRTYGLDWYDIHARQYDPIVPAWHTMDPLCESSYSWSPYAYCVGNPIDFIDPTGMDYWHTDDPDQIASFLEQIENGGFDNANLAGWHHSTDDDFLANLSYNDQTGSFLYSYGAIENGELVCYGRTFNTLGLGLGQFFGNVNSAFDAFGNSLAKRSGNSTFGYNGRFYWHGDGERGFYGNKYVSTVKLKAIGKGVTNVTGPIGKVIDGYVLLDGFQKDGGQFSTVGYNTAYAIGDVGGGAIGGATGIWVGAIAGAKIGVFGGLWGSIVGGVIGGLGGSWFGTQIVDCIYDK